LSRPVPFRGWSLRPEPRSVSFVVLGVAVPKGSMVALTTKAGRPFVTERERSGSRKWQKLIGQVAQAHAPVGGPLDGPIVADLSFFLLAPKAAPITRLALPATTPDIDKLVRATLDPLRGVCIRDDSRIVSLHVSKQYSLRPRVAIALWEARPEHLPPIGEALAEVGLAMIGPDKVERMGGVSVDAL
jgi:Holliday junction resolvase RusA-like endonuclease